MEVTSSTFHTGGSLAVGIRSDVGALTQDVLLLKNAVYNGSGVGVAPSPGGEAPVLPSLPCTLPTLPPALLLLLQHCVDFDGSPSHGWFLQFSSAPVASPAVVPSANLVPPPNPYSCSPSQMDSLPSAFFLNRGNSLRGRAREGRCCQGPPARWPSASGSAVACPLDDGSASDSMFPFHLLCLCCFSLFLPLSPPCPLHSVLGLSACHWVAAHTQVGW